METPVVSDASAGVSAMNDGEDVEPSYMHLQTSRSCFAKCNEIFHVWLQADFRMEDVVDGKLLQNINSTQQGQKNFRKENAPGGIANSFTVFAVL